MLLISEDLGLVKGSCEFLLFGFQMQFSKQNVLGKMKLNWFLTQFQNNCTFIIKTKKKGFVNLFLILKNRF